MISPRDHAKLTESEKPLLVSGTLIGLRNKAFEKSFGDYSPEDLQKQWLRVIREEIEKLTHAAANALTAQLVRVGRLCLSVQVLYEFYSVVTRSSQALSADSRSSRKDRLPICGKVNGRFADSPDHTVSIGRNSAA